jgi:hypothetical protein
MDDELLLQKFDVNRACADVHEFNNNKKLGYALAASDYLVAREFQPYAALTPDKALCAMLLLDSLWGTQVSRYDRAGDIDTLQTLQRLYEKNLGLYQECLSQLRGVKLESDPDAVCRIASNLFRPLVNEGETHKKHHSFVSKFLHWHAPEHLPIADSRALRSISSLQRKLGERQRVAPPTTASLYHRWIKFYGSLIGALSRSDGASRLEQQDRESLPAEFARSNSLLRILDKVFYMRGEPPRKPTAGSQDAAP